MVNLDKINSLYPLVAKCREAQKTKRWRCTKHCNPHLAACYARKAADAERAADEFLDEILKNFDQLPQYHKPFVLAFEGLRKLQKSSDKYQVEACIEFDNNHKIQPLF